jgi:hypothetical protein
MIDRDLFWFAVSVVVYAASAICILAFVLELRDGLLRVWRETVMSWWADRHARKMRQDIADVEAEMDVERRRQLSATVADWKRR